MKDYFLTNGIDELACKCGNKDCTLTIRPSTRKKLLAVRYIVGFPMHVSGARCNRHPEYSSVTSSHGDCRKTGGTLPCAIDILNKGKSQKKKILEAAIEAGFFRYGLGENQLHIDDDETKNKTYWIYS